MIVGRTCPLVVCKGDNMTLEEAKEYFANDRYATEATKAEIIEVGENYSKCKIVLDASHKNARGFVMGGVSFTLADFAFAVATNTPDKGTVTVSTQISFTSAPKGDILYGECCVVKEGRRNCFYTVKITDELGTLVAVANVTGLHV